MSDSRNRYDPQIERGRSWAIGLQVFEDVDQQIPFVLTGYEVQSQIRDHPGGTILATVTCSVTDETDGLISLSLTSAETEALQPNGPGIGCCCKYHWDVIASDDSGVTIIELVKGSPIVTLGVTEWVVGT
ncbi:MAG TPA: hypothetical protein VJ801_14415 [Polyangia bacterium]|nr:hypothetical protein [Polyangia bacterium]